MSEPGEQSVELVVLLTEDGTPCGTAAKHKVHHTDTPLHLAFSCWVVDGQGRTLLTRRAAVKRTWPGAWTNTFCGHPGPGEQVGHEGQQARQLLDGAAHEASPRSRRTTASRACSGDSTTASAP